MMRLETPRLILRDFTPEDWQGLYTYLSDPDVVRFEPYGVFTADKCRLEAISRAANEAFIAVTLRDGTLIGNLYFERQSDGVTYELGYVFAAAYQKQGYATEAAKALLSFAFRRLRAHRVIAFCNPVNTASWRLMERLGMRREGVYKKSVAFEKDDQGQPIWQDSYQYAILEEEFSYGL